MRQVFSAIGTIMRQKGLFSWRWRGQRKSMACGQRRVQSTLWMWWVRGWCVLAWIGDGGKPPPARLLSHAPIRRSPLCGRSNAAPATPQARSSAHHIRNFAQCARWAHSELGNQSPRPQRPRQRQGKAPGNALPNDMREAKRTKRIHRKKLSEFCDSPA